MRKQLINFNCFFILKGNHNILGNITNERQIFSEEGKYNYIDLLLYNIKFKCYAVVELKITELRKEHIGQIQVYMNYIDKNIKSIDEDKTIGIIIVKKNDKFVMEYCSDKSIFAKEYQIIKEF